ncbi:hypothetical protein [Aestuariispira insulae]|uniref:Uncharacterized protein n=1 Tax=Aestuariispira insulae TaxID=1461337 RepID=A0A3D9HB47_9PROT|nr:hypothetical protein [Aestuariispira insulae]RED46226.1 hypothetical protein DFP90_110136 [Aestuariispira insulae]
MMMNPLLITRLLTALFLLAITAAPLRAQDAAEGFLPGFEDVPVQSGLIVDEEGTVVFDSPSGRIVEVYATGPLAPESVLEFYGATLPEMGWQPVTRQRFQRENEQLSIDFFDDQSNLSVRFTLAPL